VYTSGTTASPKGVVLTHRNLVFVAHAVADRLGLTEEDRCVLMLPLCHTYGKSVMLAAFAASAAVVMSDGFGDRRRFVSRLAAERCTVLSAVPYHLHTLLRSGVLREHDLLSLRAVTSFCRQPSALFDRRLGRSVA